MFDQLNQAIDAYLEKWQVFSHGRKNNGFFEELQPTAVGWKVADLAEYDRCFNTWREACDQIHVAWLNGRWLATLHLRDSDLHGGIKLIKLMQRRPASGDALGLDHLDFFVPKNQDRQEILKIEADVKWSEEKNGECEWISVWFDNTEAKLRNGITTIDVSIAELKAISKKLLSQS